MSRFSKNLQTRFSVLFYFLADWTKQIRGLVGCMLNSSTSDRRTDLYVHFQSENIQYKYIFILVEFALTHPVSNPASIFS